jgi:hypothetical protein
MAALESNDGQFRTFTLQSLAIPAQRDDDAPAPFPRSHTCFNRIDLPLYRSAAELAGYLTLVINMDITGFSVD